MNVSTLFVVGSKGVEGVCGAAADCVRGRCGWSALKVSCGSKDVECSDLGLQLLNCVVIYFSHAGKVSV